MVAGIIAFFESTLGKSILAALGVIALVWSYGEHERLDERTKWTTYVAKINAKNAIDIDLADRARSNYQHTMEAAVDDLTTQLKVESTKHAQVQTVIKEVTKYVSKDTDKRSVDANVFTRGWVYLHDYPLTNSAPAGLPASQPGNVDAPTGLAASTVARVDAANLDECVRRGEIIGAWQKWYATAHANYEQYLLMLPPTPGTKKQTIDKPQ